MGYKYVLKVRFSYFFLVQLFILFILLILKKVEFFHLLWRAHNIIRRYGRINPTEEMQLPESQALFFTLYELYEHFKGDYISYYIP